MTTLTTELMEAGRQVLESQPFSRLLGVELSNWTEDLVELRLPIRPDIRQQHGFVHGGVIAFLADNALAFAAGAKLGGMVVSSEMKLNFIRPASGEELIARGWSLSAGRMQAVTRCDIFIRSGDELKLCAAAQGTIARLQQEVGPERP